MPNPVFTIGHSSHPIDVFLNLLRTSQVEVVADTRSYPQSKFAPQYDIDALRHALQDHGIKYIYMGRELGGRPKGADFYDVDGRVLYSRVAESVLFLEGIERLEKGIEQLRLALLCSEENPSVCHRRLLISRVLKERGFAVRHIRADGRVQSEEEILASEATNSTCDQLSLFERASIPEWKSIPSVLPRKRQNSSSGF